MSPHFCFRLDLGGTGEQRRRKLTDDELASRLSYFLWSSMPDAESLVAGITPHIAIYVIPQALICPDYSRMLHHETCAGIRHGIRR